MAVAPPKLEAADGRGDVYSILIEGKEFVISTTRKGKHRGGHAHKQVVPHYVLVGGFTLETKLKGKRTRRKIGAREIYLAKPNEFHLFRASIDSIMLEEGGHRDTINDPEWRSIVERDTM